MKDIPDKSIDMILCDLPYGVLNKSNRHAKWDSVIPFEPLWKQYERIIKDNGAIVLFGSGMFTADLMESNRKLWRYNLIWKKKNRVTGFLNAKRQPLRNHEDICVFSKRQTVYNPQMTIGNAVHKRNANSAARNSCYGSFSKHPSIITNEKYPISVLDFDKEHPQKYHPTQKPVKLLQYLIKTYSNHGDTILDNCMGSGSTGVACLHSGRRFIGMELDPEYYNTAVKRLEQEKENIGTEVDGEYFTLEEMLAYSD